ncbi:MAG: helix-turn-helix transcriptional regulator [Bacteroidetes bacterium]|nr:helix-turn-helix transcriptional regulator [Bacteroidota bacterium]HET6244267.1 metalloregulator ArsR/SmtB family transcription factor [Bacteroidia bacterium]
MKTINKINSTEFEMAAEMLKSIAHPTRLAILSLLEMGEKVSVTDIYGQLGLEQAVVSHHLGILKNKGVVVSIRDGKHCLYYLKHNCLSEILHCLKKCQS